MAEFVNPSECNLVWDGEYPSRAPEIVRRDLYENIDGWFDNPSSLIFHVVPIGPEGYMGETVVVSGTGRNGETADNTLYCEYVEAPEWVSVSDLY